jgi:imidazolonepropionase-like amidohydrolase
LDAKIGSLAKGKQADLVLWDGDPLEPLTQVKQVFIRGLPVSIESRPEALAAQYVKYHQ